MLRPDDLIKGFIGGFLGAAILLKWAVVLILFSIISGVALETVCTLTGAGGTTVFQFVGRALMYVLIILVSSGSLAYLAAYVVARLRRRRA